MTCNQVAARNTLWPDLSVSQGAMYIHYIDNDQSLASYRARAIPATANRPAATEPTFFVAAPVKVPPDGEDPEPVSPGVAGTMGEPVAAGPEPDPAPGADPDRDDVPVATGAVPVRKPVEPETPDDT